MPIIEVYGLPGAGKTHLLRERLSAFPQSVVVNQLGWGWRALILSLCHPLTTLFWIKEIIRESYTTQTGKLWRFKIALLLNTFEKVSLAKKVSRKQTVFLDEGMLQRILSFYETPLTLKKTQHVLTRYMFGLKPTLVVTNPQKEFVRYEQVDNQRGRLGSEYLQNWIAVTRLNHQLVSQSLRIVGASWCEVFPEMSSSQVTEVVTTQLLAKKLLFITQKIDQDDDILGVYHRWLAALSAQGTRIQAICLYQGVVSLPSSVRVWSLGKEKRPSRFHYVKNFFLLVWRLRNQYDVVFVHMNPEYVILGGILWRWWRKKMWFWYAHPAVNWRLRLATFLTHGVVTSVRSAFPLLSDKVRVVGQGIDVDFFCKKPTVTAERAGAHFRILYVARISVVKRLHILFQALHMLRKNNPTLDFSLSVVGEPGEQDGDYFNQIQQQVQKLDLSDLVTFVGKIPNREMVSIYNTHDLFVGLTPQGFFDKTTLEAMACELPVLTANAEFQSLLPTPYNSQLVFTYDQKEDLANKIQSIANLSLSQRVEMGRKLRTIITQQHNLQTLMDRLITVFFGDSI